MKRVVIILLAMANVVLAGVNDYLILNKKDRFSLDGLDAIVEIRVNHYYAFAEPKVLTNFVMERNRHLSEWGEGKTRKMTTIDNWLSLPDLNASVLLLTHSIWVAEAEVTTCLDGVCDTNSILVAFKKTPAFKESESPKNVLSSETNYTARVLGLVAIDKDELRRALINKRCYLKDSLDFVDKIREVSMDECLRYQATCLGDSIGKYSCYVAREIGFVKERSEKFKSLGLKKEESMFIAEMRKKLGKKLESQKGVRERGQERGHPL